MVKLKRVRIEHEVNCMTNHELFFSLTEDVKAEKFNDAYLLKLIEFWKLKSNEVDGNIFYAAYALHFGNYGVALEYAEKAFKTRKINLELWRILRDCYFHLGAYSRALLFAGYASHLYNEPVNLEIHREHLQASLDLFSLAMGCGDYAPMAPGRMCFGENGVENKASIYGGEFLPELYPQRPYHLWSGVYTEQEMMDYKGMLLAKIKDDPEMSMICGADFTFDLIKGEEIKDVVDVHVDNHATIIPLLGTERHQKIKFYTAENDTADWLGKWATSFFRLDKTTKISSEKPFIIGQPIELHHSSKRKRVVLNILIDALCWRAVQERDHNLVPYMLEFFQKGIIFTDHHSVSEYTYPSFTSIETGMYPQDTQIYSEVTAQVLNPEYLTMSEQMKRLGYYCVNIMGAGEGVYNGSARGYDRLITNAYTLSTCIGVERTIHHLEAFQECDQFLLLHTMDAHPWAAHTFQLPLTTQTNFELQERSMKDEKKRTSVYLPNRPIYHHWNEQGIRDVDQALKKLFDYLTTHYAEDEYIVQLYSDHGVPIYDEKNYILSEHQTGAALMLRGAGIPVKGFVDELTSAVDVYPILAHCADFSVGKNVAGNLPEVFGGKARDYVISMSMYPGIPLRLCIRTKEYECRAESQEALDEDGRTNLDDMSLAVYCRNSQQKIQSPELQDYFQKIIDEFSIKINNHGMQWPEMREKRKEWFEQGK